MKLIFKKEENNDITVKIQQGTVAIDFTYTEMIKQLLENNEISDTDFGNLTEEEQASIRDMLSRISEIFEDDEPDSDDTNETENE